MIIVIDAKRQQIFTASFERDGTDWKEREPAHLDSLQAMLNKTARPVHLLGEGIPFHRDFIPPDSEGIQIAPEESWRPTAAAVAKIGWPMARQGEFTAAMELLPIYIRRPEAEEKLGKS